MDLVGYFDESRRFRPRHKAIDAAAADLNGPDIFPTATAVAVHGIVVIAAHSQAIEQADATG